MSEATEVCKVRSAEYLTPERESIAAQIAIGGIPTLRLVHRLLDCAMLPASFGPVADAAEKQLDELREARAFIASVQRKARG